MSTYQLAVSLSLQAGGVAAAAGAVASSFRSIQGAASAADASVLSHQKTLDRMNFMGVNQRSRQYQYALQQQSVAATGAALANDKLAAAQRGANVAMAGAAMTGAGLMGLGVIKDWVKDASDLQDALAKVSNTTVGTSAQLAALQSQAYTVAGQTQYSAPQIMDMEAKMGRMGINRRDWVKEDIPTIARAAEVDQRMAGISPDSSIPAMISQAHMLGATHGQAFIDNIALGTRALMASGMTPDEQNTTLKYLLPAKNATGMTNAEMFQWASLSNLMGLSQGKGGSYLGAMFAKLVPGVGTKTHLEALARLQELGGGQFYKNGNMVDSAEVQRIIAKGLAGEKTEAGKQALAYYAFGTQGERAAFALTSPVAMANSDMLRHKLAPYDPIKNPTGIATVEEMQQKLNQTMVGQMNTLNTNLHSIGAMLGTVLIPNITAAAHAFVELTGGLISLGQQHPVLVQIAATAAVTTTALLLIGGPILIAAGAFAILNVAAAPFILTALGIVAGVTAAMLIFTHWGQITQWVGQHLRVLAIVGAPLLVMASGMIAVVGGIVLLFTHWGDATKRLGDFFSYLGGKVHELLLNLAGLPKAIKDIPVLGGAAGAAGAAASGAGTIAKGAADAAGAAANWAGGLLPHDTPHTIVPPDRRHGRGGGYGIGTLPPGTLPPAHYPVPAGGGVGHLGRPTNATPGHPSAAAPSGQVIHMHPGAVPVAVHFHGHQTDDAAADRIVATVQRKLSEKMRDLHRYGSLTPSGVELGFHGA